MSPIRNPLALSQALILLLFITSDVIEVTEASILETVVQISNGIESKSGLQIHCKDKHHDLGTHMLPYSQTYEFKIPFASFFGDTLYFCGFVWDHKLHWFDIYKKSRDVQKCFSKCKWVVKAAGPCFHDSHRGDHCFPWNNKA